MLRLLVLVGLSCLPRLSWAGTPTPITTIQVGNNFFSPNSININQGDTIRWTLLGGCHNITGSLSSPSAPSACEAWPFEFTFNSAGSFAYSCGVHGLSMSGVVNVAALSPTETPTFTISPTATPSPSITETLTPVPPGSTETATPTSSPSFTVSATASISPTPTQTRTAGPIQFSNDRAILAPAPVKQGQQVCAYYPVPPAYSHWDVYNAAGERVTHLDFKNEASQCWDSSYASPGIYFFRVEAQLLDGTLQATRQKVAVLKP